MCFNPGFFVSISVLGKYVRGESGLVLKDSTVCLVGKLEVFEARMTSLCLDALEHLKV